MWDHPEKMHRIGRQNGLTREGKKRNWEEFAYKVGSATEASETSRIISF
jgi:hypothetical protein